MPRCIACEKDFESNTRDGWTWCYDCLPESAMTEQECSWCGRPHVGVDASCSPECEEKLNQEMRKIKWKESKKTLWDHLTRDQPLPDCEHEWTVYSTAVGTRCLLVCCYKCKAVGTIEDPTPKEWTDAFHAPSKPYSWLDTSRVVRRETHE